MLFVLKYCVGCKGSQSVSTSVILHGTVFEMPVGLNLLYTFGPVHTQARRVSEAAQDHVEPTWILSCCCSAIELGTTLRDFLCMAQQSRGQQTAPLLGNASVRYACCAWLAEL